MRFSAVLFDCDGVLADSEAITNGVLRDRLEALGWRMSLAECMAIFVGKTVKDETEQIERRTGVRIDEAWLADFRHQRDERLVRDVRAIDGVREAVEAIHAAFGGRIACASGADRPKVEMMLGKLGLLRYFDGKIFSGQEVARNKPHPDVYLAAARHLNVEPRCCAVVEDTVTGARAGVAAGATVLGYSPGTAGHDQATALRQAGAAQVFERMEDLPQLIFAARSAGKGSAA
jgi:HAD superfamily hydrolase (TIGR01509 family)